jgi:hypothetical protein
VPRRLAAAGLVSVLALVAAGCGGGGAGPLAWPKDAGTSVSGIPVRPGQFALTSIPLDPRLIKQPLVLLGVRPEYPQDARGLRIRYGAKIIRGAAIGGARGWRPKARGLHPLDGYVVRPGPRATEIVVGAAAARPGLYLLRGFVIDYRIGSSHYHAAQQIGLQVCVDRPCR